MNTQLVCLYYKDGTSPFVATAICEGTGRNATGKDVSIPSNMVATIYWMNLPVCLSKFLSKGYLSSSWYISWSMLPLLFSMGGTLLSEYDCDGNNSQHHPANSIVKSPNHCTYLIESSNNCQKLVLSSVQWRHCFLCICQDDDDLNPTYGKVGKICCKTAKRGATQTGLV